MSKRKPKRGQGEPHAQRNEPAPSGDGRRSAINGRTVPFWSSADGNLYWGGAPICHLATHATTERPILDAFQEEGWQAVIENPIARDTAGDPTQSRRNAIANLNRRLGENPPIKFFSTSEGMVGWRPVGS